MGVLDQVLAYKRQKDAEATADISAVPQALMAFQQGQQQRTENQLKALSLQASLAPNGLQIGQNPDGGFGIQQNNSLMSNKNVLDQMLKEEQIKNIRKKTSVYDSMLNGSGGSGGIDDGQAKLDEAVKQSGLSKEDYILKPLTRMVAGVPHTVNVPELKQPLPASARKIIDEMNPVRLGLDQNLKFMEENPAVKKFMTPADIRAHKGRSLTGAIGNLLLKVDPSKDAQDFGVFKSETDKIFQKFRKETTGAQAAMAELGWLAPDFPEPDDNPELYKAKAIEALKRIDDGYNLLLDNYSAQGYRTSEVRKAIVGKSDNVGDYKTVGKFKIVSVK